MKKRDLLLLIRTLRHIPLRQIFSRLYFLSRKKYWELFSKKAPIPVAPPLKDLSPFYEGLADVTKPGPWAEDVQKALERAERLSRGSFDFLNHRKFYNGEPVWDDPSVSQLYRYHLHYFNYGNDLILWKETTATQPAWAALKFLCNSWIKKNNRLTGDGWHPYTLSLRIVNWLNIYCQWLPLFKADEEFDKKFSSSLYGQIKILASSLERDVRGNHLLKNLKALIWAGSVYAGKEAESWFDTAIGLLREEIEEQILSDGCHFERTPGYHILVLMDCIEIGLVFRRYRQTAAPSWLDSSISKMLSYLKHILPPDGQLPLLKDTTWDSNPLPDEVLAAGAFYLECPDFKISDRWGLYPLLLFGQKAWKTFRNWPISDQEVDFTNQPSSGYYVFRDVSTRDYLIVDAGAVCPEYLPAHAHADMLAYELMIGGKRVVVDSGVYEYKAGVWRDYFRSTRAHNTVEINQENQSEVWSSFRVARRARPFQVSNRSGENHVLLEAKHDGYSHFSVPVVHRRIFAREKKLFWLIVDEVRGNGSVSAASHIHFHPDVEPVQMDSHRWWLKGLPYPLWIQAFEIQGADLARGQEEPFRQGWYSERFGIRSPNTVLTLHKAMPLPFLFGYLITLEDHMHIESKGYGTSGTEVRIKNGSRVYKLCIDADGVRYFS